MSTAKRHDDGSFLAQETTTLVPESGKLNEQDPKKDTKATSTEPAPHDVLCGREKFCYHHSGNKAFRELVTSTLEKYKNAESRFEKSLVSRNLLGTIKKRGGRFLKKDGEGRWQELDDFSANEKCGHALRDAVKAQLSRRQGKKRQRSQLKSAPPSFPVERSRELQLGHDEVKQFSSHPTLPLSSYSDHSPDPTSHSSLTGLSLFQTSDTRLAEQPPAFQQLSSSRDAPGMPDLKRLQDLFSLDLRGPTPAEAAAATQGGWYQSTGTNASSTLRRAPSLGSAVDRSRMLPPAAHHRELDDSVGWLNEPAPEVEQLHRITSASNPQLTSFHRRDPGPRTPSRPGTSGSDIVYPPPTSSASQVGETQPPGHPRSRTSTATAEGAGSDGDSSSSGNFVAAIDSVLGPVPSDDPLSHILQREPRDPPNPHA